MAITISERPRLFSHYNNDSPATAIYSNWVAGWNPIVYKFSVLETDLASGLQLKIYEVGTDTLLADNLIRPFAAGTWSVDIGPYVRKYLYSDYEPDFSIYDNSKDLGNALNFYITYTQVYDNGDTSLFSSEQTRPIIACCSAKQFGDQYGENMLEYLPFNFNMDTKANFLTMFETPVMFKGYEFTLSFIYNRDLAGVQLIKRENELNINRVELDEEDVNLNTNNQSEINTLKINEPTSQVAQFMKVALYTGDGISDTYVDEGYVDTGYTQIL